jgi:CRISPR-associated protein Csc3
VPQFSEVIGNVITLPVTTIGDNKTEKYLNAVEYTLLIHKYFGLKALLSESSIPIIDLTEHQQIDIFLDGVPSILKGLIPSDELRFRRNPETENLGSGDILWQRLTAIREIHDLLHIKRQSNQGSGKKFDLDELFTLAKSFSISDHRIFFEIDRLIEKKVAESSKKTKNDKKKSKDWIAIELARKLKSPMEQIMIARK